MKDVENENLVDQELQQVLGERYVEDVPVAGTEPVDNRTLGSTGETGKRWEKLKAAVGLLLGDGLLLYMIMNGKIDQLFGVLFVAGASAFLGYHMK